MTKPCPGPVPTGRPKFKVPPGTTDTHAHILGPYDRYPLSEKRGYTAPEAPVEDYKALMAKLGIERAVIVHGSCHGSDHSVTLDAIEALWPRARGIAAGLPSNVENDVLLNMDKRGIRGIRLTTSLPGSTPVDSINEIARRVETLGWHIQNLIDGPNQMEELAPKLRGLPVPLVIDAMAEFSPPATVNHPGFRALLHLVEEQEVWVKFIAPQRNSLTGPPWLDLIPFVKTLIGVRPDRMIWGTDWPHVMAWDHAVPDDADLMDWPFHWGVDEATLKAILVDNPTRLYGF
jgi:2-pyrone-4,6-dicarboxylate lactonase